uniref:Hypothetical chloroplast protein RF1 n=1 Tax=Chlorotetraedron incus TaxID=162317 RepID=A0A140HAF8_9CHLO|nr:hypothetical chloroplast protein RF1 [Chlorotetraedron incus]AMO01157.1 hypothetical chloroplast protein RF1 [Chlorotetraedron incus]
MYTILSLVTSVKDYIEVLHKLVETDAINGVNSYYDFGAGTTFIALAGKEFLSNFLSLKWLQGIWSIPTLVPDIASAMISEISVFNGSFQNTFTLLEKPISYGDQNFLLYCLEKFMIGAINSIFLCIPTSTAHIITLRRFVMQGLEAGYMAGLGTIAGNIVWIGSVVFGLRFFVIPWLSLDILRYLLGFILLVKYMWDSYSERRSVLDDLSKTKIFLLNFLLAFTEQTNIFPFVSNLSIGSDSTILENFPTLNTNLFEFVTIHGCYLIGILVGSLSLLQLTCWFWENPAYNLYMWVISSFKVTTSFYYKFLNFIFLYLTMICAISNVAYFGLDYTITNPLGLVHEDRLVEQKVLLETAFLNSKASDRNTRRNRGRHGRRERWKRRVRRYRTFDASLYDQGVYDLFTIEDLNYGFDRFWLRRKIRNHRVRFRFFPGPWMRSLKKQFARPRLESFMGPRVEFFRILFEQAYHPEFHEFKKKSTLFKQSLKNKNENSTKLQLNLNNGLEKTTNELNKVELENFKQNQRNISIYLDQNLKMKKQNFIGQNSALRKFLRKVDNRVKISKIQNQIQNQNLFSFSTKSTFEQNVSFVDKDSTKPVYSKRWKHLFSKISHNSGKQNRKSEQNLFENFYQNVFFRNEKNSKITPVNQLNLNSSENSKKRDVQKRLSKADRQILKYKTFLTTTNSPNITTNKLNMNKSYSIPSLNSTKQTASFEMGIPTETLKEEFYEPKKLEGIEKSSQLVDPKNNEKTFTKSDLYKPMTLLHPLKFYLQKEQAFKKKFKFYGVKQYRTFGVENNAPYFRVMMKRFFYYYKPTLRWERTMRVATMRKARRKGSRIPRKLNVNTETRALALASLNNENLGKNVENTQGISSNNNEFNSEIYNPKIQKPTHFYSLVSKRASRYRYQIYKDVLQHWYYSPFNRLLLKFDVDSFIRRQPKNHFVTKKDENMLHLNRFLLSEYYNTLRWYTYMQHYNSMKSNIGGTKSLTSRAYNQQFQGTFKKIRHLFAITPLATDQTILKFDQPLYNEFPNNKDQSVINDSVIHEELLADDDFNWFMKQSFKSSKNQNTTNLTNNTSMNDLNQTSLENIQSLMPEDLKNQSAQVIREYLKNATPIRQELIRKWLTEKNYSELTKFLFRGQKLRGTSPVTNEESFLLQEKDYLLTPFLNTENNLKSKISVQNSNTSSLLETNEVQQKLWFELIRKCQNKLYDQKALKNYVLGRVEKHEKQKQRKQKDLKLRLERMKNWYISVQHLEKNQSGFTSAIQKAMKEAYNFQIQNRKTKQQKLRQFRKNKQIVLKNHLKNRLEQSSIQTLLFEKNLRQTYASFQKGETIVTNGVSRHFGSDASKRSLISQILKPFEFLKFKIMRNEMVSNVSRETYNTFFKWFNKKKDLDDWRKTENVLSKRKKIRKTLKRLRNTKNFPSEILWSRDDLKSEKFWTNFEMRKKRDLETNQKELSRKLNIKREKAWKTYQKDTSFSFENIFAKKFKRRRSRIRRYRFLKGRGPIKKRTLGEKLKGQFRFLKKYGSDVSNKETQAAQNQTISSELKEQKEVLNKESLQNKKLEIFQMITKNQKVKSKESKDMFQIRDIKQRRTRQRKHRYWKKHKKQKDAQNRRKLRKRRRYAKAKIRVLNKKFKRIESKAEVKKWWWQTFLPNFQTTTDQVWQNQKNKQIQQQLSELSISEILKRDQITQKTIESLNNKSMLQIGEKDFKPLAIPEAIRIRENLTPNILNFAEETSTAFKEQANNLKNSLQSSNTQIENLESLENLKINKTNNTSYNSNDIVAQISEKILNSNTNETMKSIEKQEKEVTLSPFMVATNSTPFYAGWDESLRKFIVTNRLLSRKDAGYYLPNSELTSNILNDTQKITQTEFSKAPLQGMNAPTTLYWQVPFTTYDPDQFFALGMDGFSPIGWRNFHFKSSKQTTKPILVKKMESSMISKSNKFSEDLQIKFVQNDFKTKLYNMNSNTSEKRLNQINQYRRIQKRYKRVKKHPRPPVWFPSGPLTNQVLPVHYIYVFYKRYRLPRDRYVRRRLRRTKSESVSNTNNFFVQVGQPNSYSNNMSDYTLRKRSKPKRKYHRKGLKVLRKNEEFLTHLRRRKFRGFADEKDRFRPISEIQKLKEQKTFQSKQRRKKTDPNSKQKQQSSRDNLRLRQLRRRVQRQVFRPIWRYKPQAGGFVWPGDYLRLELVKAPKLQTNSATIKDMSVNSQMNQNKKLSDKQRKIRKKKRRTIQEWQVQPKKYLLEKHNMKVLKKRLQKSQNLEKMSAF